MQISPSELSSRADLEVDSKPIQRGLCLNSYTSLSRCLRISLLSKAQKSIPLKASFLRKCTVELRF